MKKDEETTKITKNEPKGDVLNFYFHPLKFLPYWALKIV